MKSRAFAHRAPCLILMVIAGLAGVSPYGCVATPPPSASRPPLPAKDTETERFTNGMRAFQTGRYKDAAASFRDIIASFPGSPMLMEAQWYLARSYRAAGEHDRAVRELNLLLKNYSNNPHRDEARRLLSQLTSDLKKVVAVTWSPDKALKDRLRGVNSPGINVVILELPSNVLEALAAAEPRQAVSNRFNRWIAEARQEKLRVFVKVPFRTLPWAIANHPDWRDAHVQQGQTKERLDLFHPEVKAMLLQLCRNIARYPIDGIYIDQIAHQMEEGETISARILYERLFMEKLHLTGHSMDNRKDAIPTQSWRFAGLKSRYMTDLLDDIQTAVHILKPQMAFGVSVPEILLMDPRDGLVQASLDYVHLKAAQFDFYVITERGAPQEAVYASLQKYDMLGKTWLEESRGTRRNEMFSHFPIQGVVVSRP